MMNRFLLFRTGKRLFLFFMTGTMGLAESPVPARDIQLRAQDHAKKRSGALGLVRAEDGVDGVEALVIAEARIFGAVETKNLPVQKYEPPVREGEFWRVDVEIMTTDGPIVRPIRIDSVNGSSFGEGWGRGAVIYSPVDLGTSTYVIARKTAGFSLAVRFRRSTKAGDRQAAAQFERDTIKAVAMVMKGFPGRFEPVAEEAIKRVEYPMTDAAPDDRWWSAAIPLKEIQSVAVPLAPAALPALRR